MPHKISLLLADQTQKLHLSLSQELKPVLQVFVENFYLFFLIILEWWGVTGERFYFKNFVFELVYFIADKFVLSEQVTVDILLIDILLGSGVLNEELLQVLQFNL